MRFGIFPAALHAECARGEGVHGAVKSFHSSVRAAQAVSPWILVVMACSLLGCRKADKPAPAVTTAGGASAAPPAVAPAASGGRASAPRDVKDIACGADFACALTDDGKAWCWGRNDSGQLGTGARANEVVPPRSPVEALAPASAITAGTSHACALIQGGRVACWGSNGWGELGDGSAVAPVEKGGMVSTDNDRLQAVAVVGLPEPATAVTAGAGHTCAILASQRVACWGSNAGDELGDPGGPRSVPRVIEGLVGVEEVALGGYHTCARLAGGEVRCWGRIGKAVGSERVTPTRVEGLCAKQITAGEGFTCALSCNDEVLCWAGAPHVSRWLDHPTRVPSLPADVVEVRAGAGHVCARDGKGRLSCWGSNELGQLGDGGPKRRPDPSAPSVLGAEARRVCAGGSPTLVDFLEGGERVYGHSGTTCALSTSGEVRCWGSAMEANRPTLVALPR